MSKSIEVRIGEGLRELSLTVSVAESCTGGLVGSRLTDVAGSSTYFLGGIVAYSNDAKLKLINVQRETLAQYGAVSEATAREMAEGVRKCFGTDIGLAVTGDRLQNKAAAAEKLLSLLEEYLNSLIPE